MNTPPHMSFGFVSAAMPVFGTAAAFIALVALAVASAAAVMM